MQDGVGLGQVKNMSLHDSDSMTVMMIPVDHGTDLIKILQSKISSAGHLIIMNIGVKMLYSKRVSIILATFAFNFLNVVFSVHFMII